MNLLHKPGIFIYLFFKVNCYNMGWESDEKSHDSLYKFP
jgi:hypothetical protein